MNRKGWAAAGAGRGAKHLLPGSVWLHGSLVVGAGRVLELSALELEAAGLHLLHGLFYGGQALRELEHPDLNPRRDVWDAAIKTMQCNASSGWPLRGGWEAGAHMFWGITTKLLDGGP